MKIAINDKEYGLQWGMGCIEMYCDAMDCDIDGIDKIYLPNRHQGKALTTLIFSAMKNYAELNNSVLDVSYRQLQAWIDEADQDLFKSIMDDWNHSKYLGKTIAEYFLASIAEEEQVSKKKSPSER